jgi:hypothetical protein
MRARILLRGVRDYQSAESSLNAPHGSQRGAVPPPRRDFTEQAELQLVTPHPAAARARVASALAPQVQTKRGSAFEVYAFPVFLLMIVGVLAAGWVFKDRLGIEAEEGVGYWLGIAGIGCVGVLLIYPLRKRIPGLSFLGSVPDWFHFHMSLGLLAPTLILFHAGFRTGSVNAAIALVSMLVVAGSGLLGRMLYVRIHRDLAGKRAEVRAMAEDTGLLRQTLIGDFADVADIADQLEATLHKPRSNVLSAFGYAVSSSARITIARRRMLAALKRGAGRVSSVKPGGRAAVKRLRRDGATLVRAYCRQLKHAAYLTFFERLFALWHIVHMPLFMLMVVAAGIHIVAVHLY